MTTTSGTVTVAGYLAARLRQNGVDHLFGLPGDYNLALLDELLAAGLAWVGSTNELNASYAADGYARQRGLGAVVTTFGVGELSAMNGIAGAYAESVPVVQITGSPATATMQAGALTHHSLLDGDFEHFHRAYREVTAAAVMVTAAEAAAQIDSALSLAMDELRPVHLTVPSDVAVTLIDAAPLRTPLCRRASDSRSLDGLRLALEQRLSAAVRPVALVGHLARRRDLRAGIRYVADAGVAGVATLLDAKGLLDEAHPASRGCYIGGFTFASSTLHDVESSDCLVMVGAVLSDLVTGMFTHDLEPAVLLDLHSASVDGVVFADVELTDAVRVLGLVLHGLHGVRPRRMSPPAGSSLVAEAGGELSQAQLWTSVESWLPVGSMVVADAGSAYFGAAGMTLPAGAELVGQPAWASIGYTLPALLGVSLGCVEDRRMVLIIGDGAAQLSIQEISTIIQRGLPVLILLLDNAGYTVERAIRSPDAPYQDVARWDWIGLARAFAGDWPVTTATVSTADELAAALAMSDVTDGPVFVRAVLDRDDAPPLLASLARGMRQPAPVSLADSRA